MTTEMKKGQHGGVRPGSGRPRTKTKEELRRTTVPLVCTPVEKEVLDRKAKEKGISRSAYIMEILHDEIYG